MPQEEKLRIMIGGVNRVSISKERVILYAAVDESERIQDEGSGI